MNNYKTITDISGNIYTAFDGDSTRIHYRYPDGTGEVIIPIGIVKRLDQSTMTDINKTLTERGTRYGSFKDNGQLAQQLKQVLRDTQGWDGLDPIMQEALDLTCMKWSRIINGDPFYMDNWHDASGYMTLVHDWLQERFEEKPEPKTMHIHEPEVDAPPQTVVDG